MRFLDLDLDFFLNGSAYCNKSDSGRLSSNYKPWNAPNVRHFIEKKCGLSRYAPVSGCMVESHDEVIYFWQRLIESGRLRTPFEVTHIDAHPDMLVGNGLYLRSDIMYVDPELVHEMLSGKCLHSGNYLTFAIAYGWIGSLIWVHPYGYSKGLSEWNGDARRALSRSKNKKDKYTDQKLPAQERDIQIPFKIVPLSKFKASTIFDFMALCRSSDFTPIESDNLIPVIEEYMRQI